MNKYLPELIRIAKVELPSLEYDVENAVTPLSQREVLRKLFAITGQVLYYAIHDGVSNLPRVDVPATAAPAPAPIPVARPVARPAPAPAATLRAEPASFAGSVASREGLGTPPGFPSQADPLGLPPAPSLQPHVVTTPATTVPGLPDAQVQPGVANVFITQQGTRVVAPDGRQAALPPGEPVSADVTSATQPELPPAPEGVMQVVLPPGGGMSPEVAAALGQKTA